MWSKSFLLFVCCLLHVWLRVVTSEVLSFSFAVERKLVNLDGYLRDGVTVNDNYLGPTIEAVVGDTVLVTVWNYAIMQEVVTLHWHGIEQKGTPWADGTAFITNCPITYGSSYTYNFTVTEEGTFWYHAHVGSLSMEGTAGMIVVYSPPDSTATLVQSRSKFGTYSYDEELRIVLTDWYHPSVYTLNSMIEHNPFKWVGNGDAILINGKGESKHCSYNGTTTTVTTSSSDGSTNTVTTTCKGLREVFQLERDKTYLVRVLNGASLAFFNLAIAGHYFTILGVDGASYTQPVDIQSLDLSSGQRVMALLRLNSSEVDSNMSDSDTFLMQVQTDWRGVDNTAAGIAHAYVTYGDSATIKTSDVSTLVPPNESRNWHEWYDIVRTIQPHMRTAEDSTAAATCPDTSEVTKTFQLNALQQFVDMDTGRGLSPASVTPGTANTMLAWTVYNDSRLMMPPAPYLLSTFMSTHGVGSSASDTSTTRRSKPKHHTRRAGKPQEQRKLAGPSGESHYWDRYEVITQKLGPSDNIAINRNALLAAEDTVPVGAVHSVTSGVAAATNTMSAMNDDDIVTPALSPLRIEHGDVVDVVVQSYASGSGGCDLHPWHIHGHSFWLIARGTGVYNATALAAAMAPSASTNNSHANQGVYVSPYPLRMDTVSGYPTNHSEIRADNGIAVHGVWKDACGWFMVRFRAENPGMWLLHCHVGWHMEMGMAVVFDEASELVGAPPADYGMCGVDSEYSTYTALAASVSSDTSNDEQFEESSEFSILVSVLAVLFVLVVVALVGLWLSRRKLHGMFYQIDMDPGNNEAVVNPIGSASSGGGGGSDGAADRSAFTSPDDIADEESGVSANTSPTSRGENRAYSSQRRELEMTTVSSGSPIIATKLSARTQGHSSSHKRESSAVRAAKESVGAGVGAGDEEGDDGDVEISFVDSARDGKRKNKQQKKEGGGGYIGRTFSAWRDNIASLRQGAANK